MITRENTLRGRTVITTEESGSTAPPIQAVKHLVEIIRPDGTVLKELPGGPFAWGAPVRTQSLEVLRGDNDGRINLAKAMLAWLIGTADDPRVRQYFQRYKHRAVMTMAAEWVKRPADIKAVIEDMIEVENETAQSRTMVAMTPSPVVSEGARDVIWDTDVNGNRITRPGE